MEVEYVPRGEGWRHRGRPPQPVPEHLMTMLQRTYDQDDQAVIPVGGSTVDEVTEVVRLLRKGAVILGLRLRIQTDEQAIRFYVEDK